GGGRSCLLAGMDRFAALVSGRRAASAAAAAAAEVEVEEERDEAYLRIRLEEIVIVKNDAHDDALSAAASASAARVANNGGGAVAASSMEKRCACGDAAIDAAPALGWGSATAAAARGAWTTVTRIVGLD
ncbi:Os09g0375500, partial [Oryza sativa Japonica Group]